MNWNEYAATPLRGGCFIIQHKFPWNSRELSWIITTFALAHSRKPLWVMAVGRHIHKRRNCTLWFWRRKNFSTSNCLSRTKQQGTPHGMIIYIYTPFPLVHESNLCVVLRVTKGGSRVDLENIIVGLSALLVSTNRAMREPQDVERVTDGSTFFYCMLSSL